MAYLARVEPAHPVFATAAPGVVEDIFPEPRFSDLEWSIIRLARIDGLWTLRSPTRLRRFFSRLLGRNPNPGLANPRLEALRQMAVLSWHYGFTVPGEDVVDFIAAGFTLDQYELLVTGITKASSNVVSFPKAGQA